MLLLNGVILDKLETVTEITALNFYCKTESFYLISFQLNLLFPFKGLAKTGKKGVKKKVVDPFTRKDWYDIKAPSVFKVRDVGKTLVNRTQGTRLASDGLKGRVYEVSLADLQNETVRIILQDS